MHPDCLLEVAAAIGRTPTKAEAAEIEAGILSHMRELARAEPKWREMTGQQKLQAAAQMASDDKVAEANKAADRKASTLLAQLRERQHMEQRAAELREQGTTVPAALAWVPGLSEWMARGRKHARNAALFERMRQIDTFIAGIRNDALADLIPAIHAVEPKFFGLLDDPDQIRAFAKAVIDGDTSNPEMARAAKVYIDAIEALRVRANAAGANIGKLDYGYMPQPHDTGAIARAGQDNWVKAVLPLLDRERYVDATGQPMGDAELIDLLNGAWETLATEGRNKIMPGQRGGGSRASRFDDKHRVLHFRDADAYLAYNAEFGRGSALAGIFSHVNMMAKNIGMMEEFGANPNSTYRMLKDLAEKGDNAAGVRESLATLDMVWDTLNGTTAQPVDPELARFFQGVRNFTTAAKLQGVMLSAITDAPLQVIVAKSSGVPIGDAMSSLFAGYGKDARRVAQELGLGMDEIAGEMARWHQDHLAQGWTSKLANTTMKLTVVEAWTNSLRRGFALTLSGTLDRMRKTDWSALGEGDRRRFEASGITEDIWKIWQSAPDLGDGMLSRNSLRAIHGLSDAEINRATARLLGYIDQEALTAVLAPDLQTRAMVQQGNRAGTVGGEVLRSLMLFKSFSFAIVDKHLRRIQNIPTAQGKVAYSVAMMTSLTLFGAISLQFKDVASGKDPRDMTNPRFWMAAFSQGGGLGVFGDVLYTAWGGNSRGGQPNYMNLAGPVFGNAAEALNVARKGFGWAFGPDEKADDLRRNFGADALRFAKSNAPLVNLWYARAAVDHMVMHDMQESLSPGYLRRMQRRAQKEYGQRYWWEPGDKLPDRAPNLEAAVGEH